MQLSPSIIQKADFVYDELGGLAKEISKESEKVMVRFLLVADSKMQEEREKMRETY